MQLSRVSEVCLVEHVTLLNVKVLDFLGCPNCGEPWRLRAGTCCDGACRVALHRWRNSQASYLQETYEEREAHAQRRTEAKARRPRLKIGRRSLKALKSDTYQGGRTLTTTTMITPSP